MSTVSKRRKRRSMPPPILRRSPTGTYSRRSLPREISEPKKAGIMYDPIFEMVNKAGRGLAVVTVGAIFAVVVIGTQYMSSEEATPGQQDPVLAGTRPPVPSSHGEVVELVGVGGSVAGSELADPSPHSGGDPSGGRQFTPEELVEGGNVSSPPGSARVEGEVFTWHDGDRTLDARLQADLVVTSDGAIITKDDLAEGTTGDADRSARATVGDGGTSGFPVFRSQSGALMTLPGGVIVVLDTDWSAKQVDAFFFDNGISADRVSELGWLPNGYFVETDPGYASLELANHLAEKPGVELSSPNWWMEHSTR